MGCVSSDITRKSSCMTGSVSIAHQCMQVKTSVLAGGLGVMRCGVVCSLANNPYVRIPTEYIWLTPENNYYGDVVVYSNIEWIVK